MALRIAQGSRGGHSNKQHSHSCDRAQSTRILRKRCSHDVFLSQSQQSKPENQHDQQSKPQRSAQSTVKPHNRAVKVLTHGRSCECRVYERAIKFIGINFRCFMNINNQSYVLGVQVPYSADWSLPTRIFCVH